MARDDLRLIIDAERKTADERVRKLEQQYHAALASLHEEHLKYKKKRDFADWIWTAVFAAGCVFVVLVLT